MDAVPFGIVLEGTRCICVGGGSVAARRVPVLLAARAEVTVVAPGLEPSLRLLVESGACRHRERVYQSGDCAGAFLVLTATGDAAVDAEVAREARGVSALVCAAASPEQGNCLFMATIRRGPLVVALHGGGTAPAVTAALRARIAEALPERLGHTLERIGAARAELRKSGLEPGERARRWRRAAETGALDAAIEQGSEEALDALRRLLLGREGNA
jgi:siroheme synthase-like protein